MLILSVMQDWPWFKPNDVQWRQGDCITGPRPLDWPPPWPRIRKEPDRRAAAHRWSARETRVSLWLPHYLTRCWHSSWLIVRTGQLQFHPTIDFPLPEIGLFSREEDTMSRTYMFTYAWAIPVSCYNHAFPLHFVYRLTKESTVRCEKDPNDRPLRQHELHICCSNTYVITLHLYVGTKCSFISDRTGMQEETVGTASNFDSSSIVDLQTRTCTSYNYYFIYYLWSLLTTLHLKNTQIACSSLSPSATRFHRAPKNPGPQSRSTYHIA